MNLFEGMSLWLRHFAFRAQPSVTQSAGDTPVSWPPGPVSRGRGPAPGRSNPRSTVQEARREGRPRQGKAVARGRRARPTRYRQGSPLPRWLLAEEAKRQTPGLSVGWTSRLRPVRSGLPILTREYKLKGCQRVPLPYGKGRCS